jgi:hypothetical protein
VKNFTFKNIFKKKLKNFYKILLISLFFTINACGFEIIYRDDKVEGSYAKELAAIEIKDIHDHLYQQLKNNLINVLNYDDIKIEPKYLLSLTINKSISPTFITYYGSSGRNHLTLEVQYELRDIHNSTLISSGTASASDDFNIESKRYGNYIAEEYTQNNLTELLAQNIRSLLVNDIIEMNKRLEKIK